MARAIYVLKIYLFQDQLQLSDREMNSLKRLCIFLARVCLQAWFLLTYVIKAPYHDFLLMRELINLRILIQKSVGLQLNKI